MEKFQDKYRIPSARLRGWDYGSAGAYFITICTKDRVHYFGAIENGNMIYSPVGAIADVLWHEIKNRTKNIELGEFVVMPNHIHGILILRDGMEGNGGPQDSVGAMEDSVQTHRFVEIHRCVETLHATSLRVYRFVKTHRFVDAHRCVETLHATSLRGDKNEGMAAISPKPATVSAIIRSYKSAVTHHAHRLGFAFEWQARFHDHIIQNDASYANIAAYIVNNTLNWDKDKFYEQL